MIETAVMTEKSASAAGKELPVGVIALPVKAVRPEAGMAVLMGGLSNAGILPVIDDKKRLIGVIRDQDILLSSDFQLSARARHFFSRGGIVSLTGKDTVGTAMARFGETDQPLIPIVDDKGRYTGECASRAQLYRLFSRSLRPARVGGLATPLGVYMTSGYYSSGAGWPGLVATGAMFGVMVHVLDWVSLVAYSALITLYPPVLNLDSSALLVMQFGLMMVFLLGFLRLTPMSGLHAAEHMTINAIEKDLPLSEFAVRAQPREHQRCGTNLMVLLGGLQLVAAFVFTSFGKISPLGLLLYAALCIFLIMKFWQPAGLWIQRYFTTKTPSPAQLDSGIKAGRELLERFSSNPHPSPGFWRKIWGSGLPHMLASFLLTAWLIGLLIGGLGT